MLNLGGQRMTKHGKKEKQKELDMKWTSSFFFKKNGNNDEVGWDIEVRSCTGYIHMY